MLAVCVPVRETVHSRFAYDLAQLTAYLTRNDIDFMLFFEHGSILPQQRIALTESALRSGATQILWLDSDIAFPPNLYACLNRHQQPIVACTYSTRTEPYCSVAFTDDRYEQRLEANTGLHSVHAVGMGCMLTSIDVYYTIPKPWYQFAWSERYNCYKGEDIYFCELAQQYDYKIYVDADTSKLIKHIGTQEFLIEDVK